MKMEPTQCFEKSSYKIQTPGNYPEDNILVFHSLSRIPARKRIQWHEAFFIQKAVSLPLRGLSSGFVETLFLHWHTNFVPSVKRLKFYLLEAINLKI
jgi:hypothetical protein